MKPVGKGKELFIYARRSKSPYHPFGVGYVKRAKEASFSWAQTVASHQPRLKSRRLLYLGDIGTKRVPRSSLQDWKRPLRRRVGVSNATDEQLLFFDFVCAQWYISHVWRKNFVFTVIIFQVTLQNVSGYLFLDHPVFWKFSVKNVGFSCTKGLK